MSWFRVDDKFYTHPKVRAIAHKDRREALGLWLMAGLWVADQGTGGFIPREQVTAFDTARHRAAKVLVRVGLWENAEDGAETGYRFHDWADYQFTAEEEDRKRKLTADRNRRLRARKRAELAREVVRERVQDTPEERGYNDAMNAVIGATYVVDAETPDTDADLREHDSLTERQGQPVVDRDASRDGAVTRSPNPTPSSGDSDGGRTDPNVRERATSSSTTSPRRTATTGEFDPAAFDGIAAAALAEAGKHPGPRPDDAPADRCNIHWPLRYRDVRRAVPNCWECAERSARVRDAEAAEGRAAAAAIAELARLRATCDGCSPEGWTLIEPGGRDEVMPLAKHDCAAYARARRHLRAVSA